MAKEILIPDDSVVINKIYLMRDRKVMLDADLAELYGVETKQLKRAVRRNLIRFPDDFMFELNLEEIKALRYQIGTSKTERRGGTQYTPMAFTEQGVAMLSSILNTKRAISVNIHIVRVFTKMRELLTTHKDVLLKLEQLERKVGQHDAQIQEIFDCLKELLNPKTKTKPIGFKYGNV